MTDGERLKALRKALGLTLESFGKKIGVTKSALSRTENGLNSFSNSMIRSICREYNVSYDWLTKGEGEMFEDLSGTILDELCIEYNCDELDRKIIESYLKLDVKSKQAFKAYIRKILDE